MRNHKSLAAAIATLNALIAMPVLAAQNLNVDLGLGAEYSSNPARVSSDEESDTASVVKAGVDWSDPDGQLSGDVDYRAEYRDYMDDVEEDETSVDGRAALKWQALPRRLDFILQHQISNTQTDLRTADTASNRERRSILTGGADGYLHFSPVDDVVISPRYTDVKFSESDQSDSERANLDVTWVHELDRLSRFTVGAGAGSAKFDDETQDYDSTGFNIGYETRLARLSYSLGGGLTKFDREELDDVDGHTLRAAINFKADSFDVGGSFISELTDSSIGVSGNTFRFSDFSPSDTNFDQVDVLERSQLDLYWRHRLSTATSLNFLIGAAKDDYETLQEDEDRAYGEVAWQHALTTFWHLGARARYEQVDFSDDPFDREYDDTSVAVTALYRLTQRLDIQLALEHVDRSSDDSLSEYTDNVAMLSVNYRAF